MPTRLSRRALLTMLATPALAAGCGLTGATPTPSTTTVPAASPTTAAATAVPSSPAPAPSAPAVTSPATQPTAAGATVSRPAGTPAVLPTADLTNARRGGRLVVGGLADARTLNPLFATDPASLQATGLLFGGLARVNLATLQPEPDLAASWQMSPDSRGYTFTLRPNITFHNGQPCTAEDVAFTYSLLLSERVGAPALSELASLVERVTAVNPTTVEVRLKQVSAPFLVRHASYGIVPKHQLAALPPDRVEQNDFSLSQPVGAGPFRFMSWQRGQQLTLARHDAYAAGQPYLDEIVLKAVADQMTLQAQLKTGELDLGALREDSIEEMRQQPGLRISQAATLAITYAGFQLDPQQSLLFQDKNVRLALALALDRAAIVREAGFGLGQVAGGAVPPLSWAADAALADRLPYDPARAEQLLDGAGWAKGADGIREREGKRFTFELLTNRAPDGNGSQARERYAQRLQAAWRALGVEATVAVVDFAEVVTRLRRTHTFDVVLTAFAGDADPDQRLLWSTDAYKSGFNAGRYSNAEVDRLLNEAVRTTDQAQRQALYLTVQQTLLDDLPAIPIEYPRIAYALADRFHNVLPNPITPGYNAHLWWSAAPAG